MTEFDSFATQLLEEAKVLLEKSNKEDHFVKTTYLHSSLLLSISALEACINSVTDELMIDSYRDKFAIHEQSLLLEKEIRFDKGEFVLSNSLKMSHITDKLEYLLFKYTGQKIDGTTDWYYNLKQSIELRNKLVHPKSDLLVSTKNVEVAILSVVNAINALYMAVYKRKYPSYDRGVLPKVPL